MYYDLDCPYCDHDFDLPNHDDGYGCEEDKGYEIECPKCEKNFVFHASISFNYREHKADCLNGRPHKLKVTDDGRMHRETCEDCDHELITWK